RRRGRVDLTRTPPLPRESGRREAPSKPTPARWVRPLSAGALLIGLTLLVYQPAMRCGFIWDDDDYVYNNPTLRSAEGLRQIWFQLGATPQYYPLVHTTYWLEYRLWGLHPTGYHVLNVFWHALVAILLWRVLVVLEVPGAWVAAAVFALHPVHVESVAWITERKNVLSGACYFGAALAYLRGALGWKASPDGRRFRGLYALAFLLFLGALFAKTVTCTLPAVLLLLLWWKRRPLGMRWPGLVALLPFFAIGIAFGMLTVWMEKHRVGARGAEWDFSFIERCLLAGRVLWFYAGKLVYPANLMFIYPRWTIDATAWAWYLYALGAVGAVAALWVARRRIGRGPLVAVLCFAGSLFPALGFFNVYPMRYSFVADHFQYLPSAALLALLVSIGFRAAARWTGWRRGCAAAAFLVILTVLMLLTWRQARIYVNEETLYLDTLAKNPSACMAHNNLGLVLVKQGRIEEGIAHYRRALQLQPGRLEVWNNLGAALGRLGDLDQAMLVFNEVLRVNPDDADAHCSLAEALAGKGLAERARFHFQQALRLRPEYPEAHNNLGVVLAGQGQLDAAAAHFAEALRHRPEYGKARKNLADALVELGRTDELRRQYGDVLDRALRDPDMRLELGTALARRGRLDQAAEHFAEAVRLRPGDATAHDKLGLALAGLGRLEQALAQWTEAVRLNPGDRGSRRHLALALAQQGKIDQAVEQLRELLRIDPQDADAHCVLGDLSASQGRLDQAAAEYREALRIAPDHAGARAGLETLLTHPSALSKP
ncbi:MAG: tetratricopeptide repeat protein, partial [Planctomycetota bacterium]